MIKRPALPGLPFPLTYGKMHERVIYNGLSQGEGTMGKYTDTAAVTASFGVAYGTKDELRDLSLAVKADKQLYLCKSGGKNCVAAGGALYH